MANDYNILDTQNFQFLSTNNGVDTDETRDVQFVWNATDTAAGPSMHVSAIVHMQNTANSEAIPVALQGIVEYESTSNLINNGHLIGAIGEVKLQSTATVAAMYGLEGRFDIEAAGTATIASTLLLTTGHNSGTVENFYFVYMPDISGATGYSSLGTATKLSWYSRTPGLGMINTGYIQTGDKFIATGTASGTVSNLFSLQCHNSVNAGIKLQFQVDNASDDNIGHIRHQLVSGTSANTTFSVLNGGAETDILQLEGVNRNIGINGTSYGGGTRGIFIGNTTSAPSSNPTAGGILYTSSGALVYRGSAGTVTTIAVA